MPFDCSSSCSLLFYYFFHVVFFIPLLVIYMQAVSGQLPRFGKESWIVCYRLLVIMWFLFGEGSSWMGCVTLLCHSLGLAYNYFGFKIQCRIKVKSMQISGTEAIKTQLQPSKPKREITNITNSQNTKITYGKPSAQLFPKRWSLSKLEIV